MTKTIDTNYIMDEVELLGHLVERIAHHGGLRTDGESILGVRVLDEKWVRHTASMFEELKERRLTRQRVPRPTEVRSRNTTGIGNIDERLEELRNLPTRESMIEILSAESIRERAKEMRILQAVIDENARRADKKMEGEEEEDVLPPDVRLAWEEAKSGIVRGWEGCNTETLAQCYASYVNRVLDAYAMGPNESFINLHAYTHLSVWNDLNPNFVDVAQAEGVITNQHLDTFWNRSVKLVQNPSYDPTMKEEILTVDGIKHNKRYTLDIVFEPRALRELGVQDVITVLRCDELRIVASEKVGGLVEIRESRTNALICCVDAGFAQELSLNPTAFLGVIRYANGKTLMVMGATRVETLAMLVRPEGPPKRQKIVNTVRIQGSDGEPKAEQHKEFAKPATELSKAIQAALHTPVRIEEIEARSRKLDKTFRAEKYEVSEGVIGLTPAYEKHKLQPILKYGEEQTAEEVSHTVRNHIERNKVQASIEDSMKKFSLAQLQGIAAIMDATEGESFRIHVESKDDRKATWYFQDEAMWKGRRDLIEALQRLRWPDAGPVYVTGDRSVTYKMPLTFSELSVVFGPMEEQT